MPELARRLAEIGQRRLSYWKNNQPVFGGNFRNLEMMESPAPLALNRDGGLQPEIRNEEVTLQFVSPLKMRSPDEFSTRFPLQGGVVLLFNIFLNNFGVTSITFFRSNHSSNWHPWILLVFYTNNLYILKSLYMEILELGTNKKN